MGIVAPGNKQIGSWSFSVLYDESNAVGIWNSGVYGVVKNTDIAFSGLPQRNVMIGHYGINVLVSEDDTALLLGAVVYTVVKYVPPATVTVLSNSIYGVVKNTEVSFTLPPLKNVMIGTYGISYLFLEDQTVMLSESAVYVVVRSIDSRNETILFGTSL